MFERSKRLGLAALFVWLSAALHLLAPLPGGFGAEALRLVPFGLLYAVIGWYLPGNRRFLAWITFFVVLFGGIVAFGLSFGPSTVPDWWYWLIVIADWAAALMLFAYLWSAKPGPA